MAYKNNKYPKRTRVSVTDIVEKYPDGVTLTHFSIVDTKFGTNIVCHIEEDDTIYFYGGKLLCAIACEEWLGKYRDERVANARLRDKGGIRLRYEIKRNGSNEWLSPVVG